MKNQEEEFKALSLVVGEGGMMAWKRFASCEEAGWDAVNDVFVACLEESVERPDRLSEEEIATRNVLSRDALRSSA